MTESFFVDHFPVIINEETYLIHKKSWINIDKNVYKAILNGYAIDVQGKTRLT